MNHVGTIEKFKGDNVRWDPSLILNCFKSLKSLDLCGGRMKSLNILETVEELLLIYFHYDTISALMDRFPNMLKFTVSNTTPQTLRMISRHMPKLCRSHQNLVWWNCWLCCTGFEESSIVFNRSKNWRILLYFSQQDWGIGFRIHAWYYQRRSFRKKSPPVHWMLSRKVNFI